MTKKKLLYLLALTLSVLPHASAQQAEKSSFDPQTTHAVIVGVLHWENESYTTYPTRNRWDQKLYDALVEKGVPKDNMVLLLDKQASAEAMRKSLTTVAKNAKPGDTIIFYYAGHGVPSQGGVCFLNYDASDTNLFAVSEIADILIEEYRGKRVLMFADCCFSGGLGQTAESLSEHGFEAASVTSAAALNTSTNQWTFTHTLVESLLGNPAADRNGDKTITLDEVGVEVADAMKFVEGQLHGQSRYRIPSSFQLAAVNGEPKEVSVPEPYQLYQYVQVLDKNRWRPARVTGYDNKMFVAEIQNYSSRREVTVGNDQIRKFPERTIQALTKQRPEEELGEEEAFAKATVDGKYEGLLKKIRVESDFLNYSAFQDYGEYPATQYAGYTGLPKGYWVYVYPHWYIWETQKE